MKKCFLTQKGPKAIGPYSTAVISGNVCYMSGMLPVVPSEGKLIDGGAAEQARQVFENMKTVLEEMGLSLNNVLKTTVFLSDLGNFGAVNEVYGQYFGPNFPARSCFQVAALPMGSMIEVEAIAEVE